MENYDYFKIEAINNSSLSNLNPLEGGSYKKFKNPEPISSSSLDFGDQLHKLLLEPEKVVEINAPAPKGHLKEIFQQILLYHRNIEPMDEIDDSFIEKTWEIKNLNGFMANIKKKETWSEKIAAFSVYWNELKNTNAEDVIVDNRQMAKLLKAEQAVLENEMVCYHLNQESEIFDEGWQALNEVVIIFNYKGRKCKAKIDRLLINKEKQLAVDVDVKTTSKPVSLMKQSIEFFRYYRQRAFYALAIKSYVEKNYNFSPMVHSYIAAIGTQKPYESRLILFSKEYLEMGKKEIDFLFDYLLACERHYNLEHIQEVTPDIDLIKNHHKQILAHRKRILDYDTIAAS